MTRFERMEVALIIALALSVVWAIPYLPAVIRWGDLILAAAVLILVQTLLRDLIILAGRRQASGPTRPRRVARCMCVESLIGLGGVLVGGLLLGSGLSSPVELPCWGYGLTILLSLGLGFGVKDLVLHLKPLAIRREPNHHSIVVAWNPPHQLQG